MKKTRSGSFFGKTKRRLFKRRKGSDSHRVTPSAAEAPRKGSAPIVPEETEPDPSERSPSADKTMAASTKI